MIPIGNFELGHNFGSLKVIPGPTSKMYGLLETLSISMIPNVLVLVII